MKKIILAVVASLVLAYPFAKADEASSQMLQLKEKIIELQNQGTLGVKDFTACSQITTIGSYTPLPETKFKRNETLYVYFEPKNYFTKKSDGKYEIWLTEDIFILNEKGETLMEKPNVVQTHYNSASPILDIYFNNHIEFTDVPAGKYVFRVILYDKLKNTSASESLQFEVVKEAKPQEKQE